MKTVLTIFGATGNLMHIKLVPALIRLFKNGHIPKDTTILCVSRRDYDQSAYIDHLKDSIKSDLDLDSIKDNLHYIKMNIHDIDDYRKLSLTISEINNSEFQSLFYLAVSPEFFVDIAKGISESGLVEKGNPNGRIVFEKPFGIDFESAKQINHSLSQYFDESQIYRIDHYLGKDMIQNILVMRFGNIVLENNWSKESIDKIDIIVKETDGIGNRGPFYDLSGAMKDMVQSHLLQMLALIAMEEPLSLDSEDIRRQKIEILKKTKIEHSSAFFAQYEGYLNEPTILNDSLTETFVYLKAYVDTDRLRGVPIYLITGKRLDEKTARIVIHFKEHSLAKRLWPNQTKFHNQLVIGVSEYEGIRFQMNFKTPGLNDTVTETSMDYCHSCQKIGNNPEAYEKLLKDFFESNATLFTSWDEIHASWDIVDQINKREYPLYTYKGFDDLKETLLHLKGSDSVDL